MKTVPFCLRSKKIHRGFDDPPRLAQGLENEEALKIYRRVRDEIKDFVASLIQKGQYHS